MTNRGKGLANSEVQVPTLALLTKVLTRQVPHRSRICICGDPKHAVPSHLLIGESFQNMLREPFTSKDCNHVQCCPHCKLGPELCSFQIME